LSAAIAIDEFGAYTIESTGAMVADVQGWLDGADGLKVAHVIKVVGVEGTSCQVDG